MSQDHDRALEHYRNALRSYDRTFPAPLVLGENNSFPQDARDRLGARHALADATEQLARTMQWPLAEAAHELAQELRQRDNPAAVLALTRRIAAALAQDADPVVEEALRLRREGVKQTEVARRLGKSERWVRKIETGR